MKEGRSRPAGQETLTEVVAVTQVWVKKYPRGGKEGTQMMGYFQLCWKTVGKLKMSSF